MKLFLVLCLVAPLAVFGGVVAHDSTYEIDIFEDAPTEEQMKCIKDVVKKLMEENPDLDWWFKELEKTTKKITAKVDECKKIDKDDDRKKCMKTVRTMVKEEMDKLRKMLPTEKKDVFKKLTTGVKKCMETY